jgi:DNA invertase Pin-like site-specific DNA recombinase
MMLGEKISPDIQMDAISTCAARKGYYIPDGEWPYGEWPYGEWIIELDVTGRNFNRDITKAVAAIEQGKTHAIIVLDFSRFGRDREGNPVHLGRIERAGGELLSATEDVDARTPSGRLARGIHFEFAAYYSDVVGARWAEAFQNRLKRGRPPLGGDYFGYVRRGRQPHPLFHDRTLLTTTTTSAWTRQAISTSTTSYPWQKRGTPASRPGDATKREQYANYLDTAEHLVAVTARSNRQKADKDPAEWLPIEQVRCRYVAEWVAVKRHWHLGVDARRRPSSSRSPRTARTLHWRGPPDSPLTQKQPRRPEDDGAVR